MSEISDATVYLLCTLASCLSFTLFLFVGKRFFRGIRIVTERELTKHMVINVLLRNVKAPEDNIKFVADDADWFQDELFASTIEYLAKKGVVGKIRLRNPSNETIKWFETRGIDFAGVFQAKEDIKALLISDKIGMFVIKKAGRYYQFTTSDKNLIKKMDELYEECQDSYFEEEIKNLIFRKDFKENLITET
jgi:hypothetical protein